MHMADALLSPAVGFVFCVAALAADRNALKHINNHKEEALAGLPLIGVSAAFVFAAQMINFSIPGTGSSGHIGGGLLLAILLGPHAALLAMTAILFIQAFMFADGGLLALGANIINMGWLTCFAAFLLVYKPLAGKNPSNRRLFTASVLAAVAGLQMGAFAVVLQTFFSGKTELPFITFLIFMQPIHLAIGLVEGLLTGTLLVFVQKQAPGLIVADSSETQNTSLNKKAEKQGFVVSVLAVLALVCGGFLAFYASGNPDGLEWSVDKTLIAGTLEESAGPVAELSEKWQSVLSLLPDYGFRNSSDSDSDIRTGTALSGVAGSLISLALVTLVVLLAAGTKKRLKQKKSA